MGPTHVLIIRRSFLCVSCEISSAASDRAQLELERVRSAAVKKFQLKLGPNLAGYECCAFFFLVCLLLVLTTVLGAAELSSDIAECLAGVGGEF